MQQALKLPERIFFIALALGFAAIIYLYHTELNHRIEYAQQSQITMAKGLLQAAKSAKEQYAKTVVDNIDALNFHNNAKNVPLPFTFAKKTGHLMSESMDGLNSRIYSMYPFPGRQDQRLDTFQQQALNALVTQREKAYWGIEKHTDDAGILRYAEPVVMSKACIHCHNDPKFALHKQDWKPGDVRGVWEISMPVDPRVTHPHDISDITFVLLACSIVTVGFVGFVYLKSSHRKQNALASLSVKLGREALKFEKAANTDALTGLGNRRAFENRICEVFDHKHYSSHNKVGLLLLDLDHFKRINDQYGHDVGDQVLIAVARALQALARTQDGVFRIGGEEFAIVVRDIDRKQLTEMGERIRASISQLHLSAKGNQIIVRASVGGALSLEQDSMSEIYKRADLALYSAKENGRNQVKLSEYGDFALTF